MTVIWRRYSRHPAAVNAGGARVESCCAAVAQWMREYVTLAKDE